MRKRQVVAMILSGGQGERLSILSQERAKPAVPFGGRYRIIDFHRSSGAAVTIGVTEVPWQDVGRFGTVVMDEHGRVKAFEEKSEESRSNMASMGIYVFDKEALRERLIEDAHRKTSHDFGADILPAMVEKDAVFGYPFRGYWRDVGTVEAYWQANMDLLLDLPELNLYDPDALIQTKTYNYPPAKIGPRAHISRSIICEGCIVDGYVDHSILSPGVRVEEGAVIRDSIVFNDTVVQRGATIDRCIVDKKVVVGHGSQLGWGDDYTPNRQDPSHLNTGITLVGKSAQLPPGLRVGRNCMIGPGVDAGVLGDQFLVSGASVVDPHAHRMPF